MYFLALSTAKQRPQFHLSHCEDAKKVYTPRKCILLFDSGLSYLCVSLSMPTSKSVEDSKQKQRVLLLYVWKYFH